MSAPAPDGDADPGEPGGQERRGTAYGLLAYFLWGVFPLYFRLLEPAGAVEVVVHRVLWTLVVCTVVLAVVRRLDAGALAWVRPLRRQPGSIARLATAAVFLALNWGVYVYAVNAGHVVEAALGYFINPLVTVLLGVLLLRERLRPLQWAAVGLGAVAVAVLTVDYGRPPWIALVLAGSFGTYGLMKKRVGVGLGALASLTSETLLIAPLALAALVWLEATGRGTATGHGAGHALLLASSGVVTAIPLLLFAAAARRVPLVTVGLLQFLTPVLQLLCGVLLLGERVPATRWVGFGVVWLALVLLSLDSVRTAHARRRLGRQQQDERSSSSSMSTTPSSTRA